MDALRFFPTVTLAFVSLLVTSSLFGQEDATPNEAPPTVPEAPAPETAAPPSATPAAAAAEPISFVPSVASTVAAVGYDDSEPLPLRWAALDRLRTLKLGTTVLERSAVLGKLFTVASRESDHPKIRLLSLAVIDEFLATADTDHSTDSKSYDVLASTSMMILHSKRTDDDVQIAAAKIAMKHVAKASTDSRTVFHDACKKAIESSDTLPRVREFLISSFSDQ